MHELRRRATKSDETRKRLLQSGLLLVREPVPHERALAPYVPSPRPMSLLTTKVGESADWTSLVATGHRYATARMTPDEQANYLARDILVPLYTWQNESLAFAEARERDDASIGTRGLMLCHEQGLGKTLISLQHVLRENQTCCRADGRRFNGTTLIVCKDAMLLENWLDEARHKWPPGTFHYYHLQSSGNDRIDPVYLSRACDFVIVTYATVRAAYTFGQRQDNAGAGETEEVDEKESAEADYKFDVLFGRVWKRVIADEAHVAVNQSTLLHRAMLALQSEINWSVTATPIQNTWQTLLSSFAFIRLPGAQHLWSADPVPSLEQRRLLNEACRHVMLRIMKRDIAQHAPGKGLGLFTTVTKRIRLIEFESPLEKLVYFQYALYGTRKWHTILPRWQDGEGERANATNVGHHIMMLQLCLNLTIVPRLVLPHGLLTGKLASTLPLLATPFNEAILPPSATGVDPDDMSLADFASRLCRRTRFTYRTTSHEEEVIPPFRGYTLEYRASLQNDAILPLTDAAREETFVWDPYAATAYFDLTNSEKDRRLYGEMYTHFVDRTSVPGLASEKKCAMLEHLARRTLPHDFCATKNLHVIDYVRRQMAPDERAIVFSTSVKALTVLAADLTRAGIDSVLISGTRTTAKENSEKLRLFSQEEGGPRVLLLSMKLGAEGLNITRANHVLFLQFWWNPEIEAQAEARTQRIGQTKPIYITHFVMNKTIELFVAGLAHNKTRLTTGIIDKKRKRRESKATELKTALSYDFADYTVEQ